MIGAGLDRAEREPGSWWDGERREGETDTGRNWSCGNELNVTAGGSEVRERGSETLVNL